MPYCTRAPPTTFFRSSVLSSSPPLCAILRAKIRVIFFVSIGILPFVAIVHRDSEQWGFVLLDLYERSSFTSGCGPALHEQHQPQSADKRGDGVKDDGFARSVADQGPVPGQSQMRPTAAAARAHESDGSATRWA